MNVRCGDVLLLAELLAPLVAIMIGTFVCETELKRLDRHIVFKIAMNVQ